MDIREDELRYRMTLKLKNDEERYFAITQAEMQAILISSGKPTSICLTDQTGEQWWISLMKAHIDIDMRERIMLIHINPQKENQ